MTKISIVIVNYNVKYFVKQCLQSIFKSKVEAELEIIIVDNNSYDGSVAMIKTDFPEVKLIANNKNFGFGKANNQGFEIATGDYILILNPDTIIEETTLQKCLDYCRKNQNVGAIGVKMLDGAGNYLPESKRGFPTPLRSIFKLLGVSKLFKNSPFINGYYLGNLDNNKTNEVEVLTGAFMFAPKAVIDDVNGFDEDYFMYGEDIELCFQIRQKGKQIIYLPETSIIHFKGESTKKASINYLKNFYGAMSIYAQKRNKKNIWIWKAVLNLGILLTALVSVFKKLFLKVLLPIIDLFLILGLGKLIQNLWANVYYNDPSYYSHANLGWTSVVITTVLVGVYYLFGHYDKRYEFKQLLFGFVFSFLIVLSLYAVFPSEWRFSRIVLLTLLFLSPFILYATRRVFNYLRYKTWRFNVFKNRRMAIVGSQASFDEIKNVVLHNSNESKLVGRISLDQVGQSLGSVKEIDNILQSRFINELIFCTKDIDTEQIFKIMASGGNEINFKIASDDNTSILGSDSKDRVGDWYTLNIDFKIKKKIHKRTKRLIDIVFSLFVIIISPILLLISKNRKTIIRNTISVLIGQKTWISYNKEDIYFSVLPPLKMGVFSFDSKRKTSSPDQIHQSNIYYARNYNIWMETEQILKNIF